MLNVSSVYIQMKSIVSPDQYDAKCPWWIIQFSLFLLPPKTFEWTWHITSTQMSQKQKKLMKYVLIKHTYNVLLIKLMLLFLILTKLWNWESVRSPSFNQQKNLLSMVFSWNNFKTYNIFCVCSDVTFSAYPLPPLSIFVSNLGYFLPLPWSRYF